MQITQDDLGMTAQGARHESTMTEAAILREINMRGQVCTFKQTESAVAECHKPRVRVGHEAAESHTLTVVAASMLQ